jgi:tyrosyl-tRNA synthetase
VRQPDADVERLLKLFTFLPITKINEIMTVHNAAPEKRTAQHLLAREFVELTHGFEEAESAQQQHRSMFSKDSGDAAAQSSWEQQPDAILPRSMFFGKPFSAVLLSAALADSKSEATRLVKNKGAYIHAPAQSKTPAMDVAMSFAQINDPMALLNDSHLSRGTDGGEFLILRSGKRKVRIIKLVSDAEFEKEGLGASVREDVKG